MLRDRRWGDPALGQPSRLVLSGFYADVVEPQGPIVSLPEERGFRAVACDRQTVCPWNREHLERPLDTPRTRSFRRDVDGRARPLPATPTVPHV